MFPLLLASLLQVATYPPYTGFDLQRAQRNYVAIVEGSKRLGDLSPAEQIEVRQLDENLRDGEMRPKDTRAECIRKNATSDNPSPLERSVLDLKCSQRRD